MSDNQNNIETMMEKAIKSSVYLAVPFLFTLVAALGVLFYSVVKSVWKKLYYINDLTKTDATVLALELVDVVLIVNLVLVIGIASYHRLIYREDSTENNGFGWLASVSMGAMKTKLLGSCVAISAISLLADVVKISDSEASLDMHNPIMVQAVVHMVLAISAWMMAKGDH